MLKFIFLSVFVCISLTGCAMPNSNDNNNASYNVIQISTSQDNRF